MTRFLSSKAYISGVFASRDIKGTVCANFFTGYHLTRVVSLLVTAHAQPIVGIENMHRQKIRMYRGRPGWDRLQMCPGHVVPFRDVAVVSRCLPARPTQADLHPATVRYQLFPGKWGTKRAGFLFGTLVEPVIEQYFSLNNHHKRKEPLSPRACQWPIQSAACENNHR